MLRIVARRRTWPESGGRLQREGWPESCKFRWTGRCNTMTGIRMELGNPSGNRPDVRAQFALHLLTASLSSHTRVR